jgi:hypothetical protein
MSRLQLFLHHAFIFVAICSSFECASGQLPAPSPKAETDPSSSPQHATEIKPAQLWYGVLKTPNREFRFVIELNTGNDSS